MLKIAIVGMGGISQCHLDAWLEIPEAKVIAICDIRPEQLIAPSERTQANCYTSFDEMLSVETIDILDICLPTYLHADFAVKALEQGLHVLIEKPISLNPQDVERIYSAAKHSGKKVMVAQVLRFWKEYALLREIYQSKKYGELLSGSMSRLGAMPGWSWDGWMHDEKRSGLVPFDLHIHDIDFVVAAFGVPKDYHGHRAKGDGQDYLKAIYQYDTFFISCEASWYVGDYNFNVSYRFQFEKAVVEYSNNKVTIYEKDGKTQTIESMEDDKELGINLPSTGAYYNEIRYFTDCVLNNRDTDMVPMEELQAVLKILKSL